MTHCKVRVLTILCLMASVFILYVGQRLMGRIQNIYRIEGKTTKIWLTLREKNIFHYQKLSGILNFFGGGE